MRDEHSNAEGKSADRKDGGAYKIQGSYFVVGMSLPNFGLQWNLVRFELGTVMTDSMKKCPVHCEATVTIRRFEKDKSDIEYYGRIPRPLLEQVLEQQVEDGSCTATTFRPPREKKESRRNEMAPETLMKRTVACQT